MILEIACFDQTAVIVVCNGESDLGIGPKLPMGPLFRLYTVVQIWSGKYSAALFPSSSTMSRAAVQCVEFHSHQKSMLLLAAGGRLSLHALRVTCFYIFAFYHQATAYLGDRAQFNKKFTVIANRLRYCNHTYGKA